ncbi:MAG: hypothetical protein KJ051_00365 [Thermoleophilia bacterium]|nr:hypothetical protein [Thermoleophilia bacterium]
MPEAKKEAVDQGVLERLAVKGDEAIRRLREEAHAAEALERLTEARGRAGKVQRGVLHQLNVAPLDEVEALRAELDRMEKRLAKLEKLVARPPAKARSHDAEGPAG